LANPAILATMDCDSFSSPLWSPGLTKLSGSRVLLVEDETLVLFNLEDILSELGCEVVAQAMRFDKALELARTVHPVDVAILDVNLGGQSVFPVAEVLAGRSVPTIFATGYDRDGLPPEWRDFGVIMKPYTLQDVERALLSVLEGREPSLDAFTIASKDQ
jgi:DNA-binding NarL/FixJ family response regulator